MTTIPAGLFKAKCLSILDEVSETHEPVIITKRGRPVAKLVPIAAEPHEWFGSAKDDFEIIGDIVEPVGEIWEADQ